MGPASPRHWILLVTFSFIQITDHHLGESDDDRPYGYPAADTLRAVMDHIAAHAAETDFIVSTGDLVNHPTDAAYQFLVNLLALSPSTGIGLPHSIHYGRLWDFPMYLMPGNHDNREAFFNNLFSGVQAERFNMSFLHKDVRFVCLDWGPIDRAELTPELLDFTRGALSGGEPAVLLMHHNVVPSGRPWLDRFIADDIDQFFDVLRGKNVLAMLCGHLHTSYTFEWEGVPVYGLRSTAFQFRYEGRLVPAMQPPHYRVVTVNPAGGVDSHTVEVPLPGTV